MKKYFIILAFLFSVSVLKASEPFWDYVGGPNGGNCLAINYNNVDKIAYLVTTNGIYKSSDKGDNWDLYYNNYNTSGSNPNYSINDKGIIFAYYPNSLKFSLKFPGEPEKYLNTNFQLENIFRLVITNNNELLVSYSHYYYPKLDTVFFAVSKDFGGNWIHNKFTPPENLFNKSHLGIYTSDNFDQFNKGYFFYCWLDSLYNNQYMEILLKFDSFLNITDTIVCPKTASAYKLYDNYIFGCDNINNIILYDNSSKTWYPILNKIGILFIKDSSLYIFAGEYDSVTKSAKVDSIYVTYDFGKSINSLYYNDGFFGEVFVSDEKDFFSVNSNSFLSFDKTVQKWISKVKGVHAQNIYDLNYDKKNNIYAVAYGVHKSSDNGNTWKFMGLGDQQLFNILVGSNGFVYASGNIGPNIDIGGIYRSTDEGKTWVHFNFGLNNYSPLVTDLFESHRGYIFAGAVGAGGYFYSTDHGETWQLNSIPDDDATNCFSMNSEGHIFRGAYGGIVYRSTDDGETWERMTEYFSGINCFWDIGAIAFDPRGEKGFALCLKTTDNGRKWIQSDIISSDACNNFDSLGNFVTWHWDASTDKWQVFRSSNKGNYWENISSGINHNRLNLLSVSPNGYYFTSAENGGLYRSRDKFVSVEEKPKPTDDITINPNPASDFIEVQNPNYEKVTILNILGETIYQTTEISKIDVSSYPTGIYLVRIGDKVSKFVKI